MPGDFEQPEYPMLLRERFPIFESKAYINSCSHGALSSDVRAAYEAYLRDRDQYGSPWEDWVGKLETLRAKIARLLNAAPDEIAVTSSLSSGLNALVSAMQFESGRRKVVLTDFDFPTTAQIWRAQERRGAQVVTVPSSADGKTIPLAHFEQIIDEQTLLVSIPHVCYRNGSKLDIEPIIALAKRHGALVFLDCYQSIGTTPIDAKALDVDFMAGGLLKYLVSSAGVAFMYVRQSLVESLEPTSSGWFCQADIHAMDISSNRPAPSARRFEGGTPNVPNLYAGIAGLDLILGLGVEVIERDVSALIGNIKSKALDQGYRLAMPEEASQHGFLVTLESTDMNRLVRLLGEEGVITSCRDDNLRISPHFYNNEEDVERLFAGLNKHRHLLRRD